jgi:hypothetical protein
MYSTTLCTLLLQGREGYTHLWNTLKGWELEEKGVHKLVEYIKGVGAGREGYTHLWRTLKGCELEENLQLPSL